MQTERWRLMELCQQRRDPCDWHNGLRLHVSSQHVSRLPINARCFAWTMGKGDTYFDCVCMGGGCIIRHHRLCNLSRFVPRWSSWKLLLGRRPDEFRARFIFSVDFVDISDWMFRFTRGKCFFLFHSNSLCQHFCHGTIHERIEHFIETFW